MADVGGPIRSLPGALLRVPPNTECDQHEGVLAVKRVQGETDSFGYEAIDMCQQCYDEYLAGLEHPEESICDRCFQLAPLKPFRLVDEGPAGPVYYYCTPCIHQQRQEDSENYGYEEDED